MNISALHIARPRYPRPFNPYRGVRHHRNLSDQHVGPSWRRGGCWCSRPKGNGHVIDLNNNGRYDRGRDGVLVFDTNRDGRYDNRDVSSTNDMMKAARGNYDFNGDGRVSRFERIQGSMHRRRFAQLDRNRDGRLSTHEIARGGGKVWVDKSRGGGIGRNELHSPYRLPNGPFGGSRRLDSVGPWGSRSSNNQWWRPFGGRGLGLLRPGLVARKFF